MHIIFLVVSIWRQMQHNILPGFSGSLESALKCLLWSGHSYRTLLLPYSGKFYSLPCSVPEDCQDASCTRHIFQPSKQHKDVHPIIVCYHETVNMCLWKHCVQFDLKTTICCTAETLWTWTHLWHVLWITVIRKFKRFAEEHGWTSRPKMVCCVLQYRECFMSIWGHLFFLIWNTRRGSIVMFRVRALICNTNEYIKNKSVRLSKWACRNSQIKNVNIS